MWFCSQVCDRFPDLAECIIDVRKRSREEFCSAILSLNDYQLPEIGQSDLKSFNGPFSVYLTLIVQEALLKINNSYLIDLPHSFGFEDSPQIPGLKFRIVMNKSVIPITYDLLFQMDCQIDTILSDNLDFEEITARPASNIGTLTLCRLGSSSTVCPSSKPINHSTLDVKKLFGCMRLIRLSNNFVGWIRDDREDLYDHLGLMDARICHIPESVVSSTSALNSMKLNPSSAQQTQTAKNKKGDPEDLFSPNRNSSSDSTMYKTTTTTKNINNHSQNHIQQNSYLSLNFQQITPMRTFRTIEEVNREIDTGRALGVIRAGEAYHAAQIAELMHILLVRKPHAVFIGGGFGSGRVSFAARLSKELRMKEIRSFVIHCRGKAEITPSTLAVELSNFYGINGHTDSIVSPDESIILIEGVGVFEEAVREVVQYVVASTLVKALSDFQSRSRFQNKFSAKNDLTSNNSQFISHKNTQHIHGNDNLNNSQIHDIKDNHHLDSAPNSATTNNTNSNFSKGPKLMKVLVSPLSPLRHQAKTDFVQLFDSKREKKQNISSCDSNHALQHVFPSQLNSHRKYLSTNVASSMSFIEVENNRRFIATLLAIPHASISKVKSRPFSLTPKVIQPHHHHHPLVLTPPVKNRSTSVLLGEEIENDNYTTSNYNYLAGSRKSVFFTNEGDESSNLFNGNGISFSVTDGDKDVYTTQGDDSPRRRERRASGQSMIEFDIPHSASGSNFLNFNSLSLGSHSNSQFVHPSTSFFLEMGSGIGEGLKTVSAGSPSANYKAHASLNISFAENNISDSQKTTPLPPSPMNEELHHETHPYPSIEINFAHSPTNLEPLNIVNNFQFSPNTLPLHSPYMRTSTAPHISSKSITSLLHSLPASASQIFSESRLTCHFHKVDFIFDSSHPADDSIVAFALLQSKDKLQSILASEKIKWDSRRRFVQSCLIADQKKNPRPPRPSKSSNPDLLILWSKSTEQLRLELTKCERAMNDFWPNVEASLNKVLERANYARVINPNLLPRDSILAEFTSAERLRVPLSQRAKALRNEW